MPNWNDVFKAIQNSVKNGAPDAVDTYRHKALKRLFDHTQRNIIAYYSGWLSKPGVQLLGINDEDMNGFMNAVHGLDKTKGVDLILHTPGGSIASAESIVNYLHLMFQKNMRVIVPQVAMSAGTMIACSSKEIILGKQSSLGPIDPQIRDLAAQGVLNEFKKAVEEIKKDPDAIHVWRCILQQYHPTFLGQCQQAIDWTKAFVADQLRQVMFEGDPDAILKSKQIVEALSDADEHKSHERHIPIAKCRDLGLKVVALEDDNELQELVLTVHHCYMFVLTNTGTFKIIENHKGSAFAKQQMQFQLPMQGAPQKR
ncbi:SDH family Clp fold serine proteinase [Acidicapsa acidisoli]|uniref:SDH family Clp fold serine proteinase n=1 Tax=Acidicapsa acidisoli TaxID=1615681 RepID=UPI0021DFFC50|nr:ATP-dependent Clp protease proteolytic subunit [Acidicapsa acidisoli]